MRQSTTGAGVVGKSNGAWIGVYGESASNEGVHGVSHNKDHGGVVGINDDGGIAVYGKSVGGDAATRFAGYFDGRVGIAGGTDVAERFSSASAQTIEPGMVVVVDAAHPGKINPSASAYDRTVVGIVSGAGGVEPGLILHQRGIMDALTVNILSGSGFSVGTPRMLNVNVQTVYLDGIRSSALSHICSDYTTKARVVQPDALKRAKAWRSSRR